MIGIVVNVVLRASMLAMLAAVTRAGRDDPRYVGKGSGVRFGLVAMPSSLLVPALWLRGRGRRRAAGLRPDPYPFWMDDLWISLLALDLAGNVLDLYDRYTHFDLIPHAHGTGALTVTVAWLLRLPPRRRAAVDAVQTQMSPLVQIALIDFIVKTGERESLDVLKRIADDPQVHEAVRARATWGVQMLG